MSNELYNLASYINNLSPLNRYRDLSDVVENLKRLSHLERIDLLVYSFQSFDRNYNYDFCMSFPFLWVDFDDSDWKSVIERMFPRRIKFEMNSIKNIDTGWYFDIFFLNAVVGVSPFKFIFEELEIDDFEKESFRNYLIHFGEMAFFNKERELIENVVNFYELKLFSDIVTSKEILLKSESFELYYSYSEVLKKYAL